MMQNQSSESDTGYMWKLSESDAYIGASDKIFLPEDVLCFFRDLMQAYNIKNRKEMLSRAGLDGTPEKPNKYGYEVFRGEKKASREFCIRLALGVGLNLRDTQRMLAVTGVGCLHPRNRKDALIAYAIVRHMSYREYQELDPALLAREGDGAGGEKDGTGMVGKPQRSPDTAAAWSRIEGGFFPGDDFFLSSGVFLPEDISGYFGRQLERLGISKTEVLERANISEYGYQILDGSRIASRDYYIRLAMAMGLSVRDTQRMLAVTGRGCLHPMVKRDFALIHILTCRFDSIRAHEFLISLDLAPLEKDDWEYR